MLAPLAPGTGRRTHPVLAAEGFALFDAFVSSASHRHNLCEPAYTLLGVSFGADGAIYTGCQFLALRRVLLDRRLIEAVLRVSPRSKSEDAR